VRIVGVCIEVDGVSHAANIGGDSSSALNVDESGIHVGKSSQPDSQLLRSQLIAGSSSAESDCDVVLSSFWWGNIDRAVVASGVTWSAVWVIISVADSSSSGVIVALEALGAALSSSGDPSFSSARRSCTSDSVTSIGRIASGAALQIHCNRGCVGWADVGASEGVAVRDWLTVWATVSTGNDFLGSIGTHDVFSAVNV